MKKSRVFICVYFLGIVMCFISCDKSEEIPPKSNDWYMTKEIEAPRGEPLSSDDRAVLEALRAEYEAAQ